MAVLILMACAHATKISYQSQDLSRSETIAIAIGLSITFGHPYIAMFVVSVVGVAACTFAHQGYALYNGGLESAQVLEISIVHVTYQSWETFPFSACTQKASTKWL